MNPKTAKIIWTAILVMESIVLAAFLLSDFGVINTGIDLLSFNSIIDHIVAAALIIAAIIRLRELKK